MAPASAWIRGRGGGIAAARVFTRIWLALFGWWKWDDLPELPPELIFFPKWVPLNIYDFGCWARQTIVPLTVVSREAPGPAGARSRSTSCTPTPRSPNPAKPLGPAGQLGRRLPAAGQGAARSTARSRRARLRRPP